MLQAGARATPAVDGRPSAAAAVAGRGLSGGSAVPLCFAGRLRLAFGCTARALDAERRSAGLVRVPHGRRASLHQPAPPLLLTSHSKNEGFRILPYTLESVPRNCIKVFI